MLPESSLTNPEEFFEVELSKVEEHMLQLLEDMNREIIWVNRTQKGIVPGALNILKNFYSDIEAFHILEALVRKGMLDRIDNGILLLCPSCGSHESSIIESCPSCGSIKLRQKHKVVHAPCEHWGTFDEFQGGNTVTCPVCSEEIESEKILENKSGFSYSDPYYECQECNFSSNKVRSMFLCTSCKKKFQASNAVKLEQTGFTVTVEPVASEEITEIPSTPEIEPEPMESTEPEEDIQPNKKKSSTKRKAIKLLDELEKVKKQRAKEEKTVPQQTSEETIEEIKADRDTIKVETSPQIPVIEPEPETEPEEAPEPVVEEKKPEIEPEATPEPIKGNMESEIELELVPEPVEEEPEVEQETSAPEKEVEEEETPEPVEKIPEIEPEIVSTPVIEVEEEKTLEPVVGEEPKDEIEQEETVEEVELEVEGAPSDLRDVYEEDPVKEDSEEPEEESYKVLFVVENQMVCNFVLEGLQKSKYKIELNLVEDGALALKALRRVYDMIIFDSGLESVDPMFVLDEMIKWKIKSPMVIIDEGTLGKIPKKLNVVAKLKRKQRDIRKIKKLIWKTFKR